VESLKDRMVESAWQHQQNVPVAEIPRKGTRTVSARVLPTRATPGPRIGAKSFEDFVVAYSGTVGRR
jgi:hypothetical protein